MYEDILVDFTESESRYLVIGGVAVVMHGYVRTTQDLDILPDLNSENLERMISVLERYGYKPLVPVNVRELKDPRKRKQWYEEKNMKVFQFTDLKNPPNPIDFMIYQHLNFEEAFQRKQIYPIRGTDIYVASIDDLIKLKKEVFRDRDRQDIIALEKLKKGEKLEVDPWDPEGTDDKKINNTIMMNYETTAEQRLNLLKEMMEFARQFAKAG